MESKHGGSPQSGIVAPAGLGTEQPAVPGGKVLEPLIAAENRNARDRALQFERRRLALVALSAIVTQGAELTPAQDTRIALEYADELLKQTGGHV